MTSSTPQKRVEEIHKAIQDEVAGEMWYESRQNEEKLQRLLVNLEKRLVRDFTQHHHSLLAEKESEIVRELEGEKQSKPKGKCINAENHLFGSCFECKKIDGHNFALDQAITIIKEIFKR